MSHWHAPKFLVNSSGLLLSTKGLSELMCINYHVNLMLSSVKIKKRLIVLKIRRYLTA